jgi:hypothetical protein
VKSPEISSTRVENGGLRQRVATLIAVGLFEVAGKWLI